MKNLIQNNLFCHSPIPGKFSGQAGNEISKRQIFLQFYFLRKVRIGVIWENLFLLVGTTHSAILLEPQTFGRQRQRHSWGLAHL